MEVQQTNIWIGTKLISFAITLFGWLWRVAGGADLL